MARPRIIGSLIADRHAAEQRVGDADADEPRAERRHEGGDLQLDVDDAVEEADAGADAAARSRTPNRPRSLSLAPFSTSMRQDHRAERQHALDREVDRAHQDDEGGAEAEHQRDHRGLADADEIAEGQEIRD